ncbi:cocaine esterase-like isoform X1 [Ptychodera flava]|uniref:cocaine esterase-like isoform X1 n=1 Tax=Ptychodera flava TaxID=63121 RepID=UPI00396AA504
MAAVRFVVFVTTLLVCVAADDPIVELKSGKVAGRVVEFAHKDVEVKRKVHVFQGIPFAEPPVGGLRFRAPEPKSPWQGVRDAKELGNACMQPASPLLPVEEPKSEDCLYLNIFVPQTGANKLPVMVWIHGGGLVIGSGGTGYDGTALAAIGDVIVVTINYRLGPFGYLSSGDEHATGNYGFLDQVLALQWVQDNIAAFGGDANKVTLFGESAGGISIEYLMLSPLTDGLFHRAIMESGTSTMPGFFISDEAKQSKIAHGLGKLVDCEKDTSGELLQCLRGATAEDLKEAGNLENGKLANLTGISDLIPFPPVVDGNFLTASPEDLIRDRSFPKRGTDIMIGSLADEGRAFLIMLFLDNANDTEVFMNKTTYEAMSPLFLGSDKNSNQAVVDAIKLMYVNWEDADSDDADYVEALSQTNGDLYFVCPADLSARAHFEAGSNVYQYQMTHIPAKSLFKMKWLKAIHGEDIAFVFGWHFNSALNWTMPEDDVMMTLKIIKYWTNFAKTGNPNLSDNDLELTEDEKQTEWPLFKVPGLEYKDLSPKMETKRALKAKECAFWNDFIPKLMKHTDVAQTCSKETEDGKLKYKEEENRQP